VTSGGLWSTYFTRGKGVFEEVPPSQVSRVLVSTAIARELALLINGFLFEGKTCLLYYILILCLILAQPIVFQDMGG
jgi:hypothetical protein